MPTTDTSFYSTIPAPQPQSNPLAVLQGYAGVQNALNQAQMFQQEFAARRAIGQIMQGSIEPDGSINWPKAIIGVSTHPESAWKAPEFVQSIIQRENVQADTVLKTLKAEEERMGTWGATAAGLIQRGKDGLSHKDASGSPVPNAVGLDDVVSAVAALPPERQKEGLKFLVNLPKDRNGQYDPKASYQQLLQFALRAQGAQASLANTFRAATDAAGGVTRKGLENVYQGTYAPLQGTPGPAPGVIPHEPTVAERAQRLEQVGPQGQRTTVPAAQVPGALQTGAGTEPMAGGATPGATPVQTQTIAAPGQRAQAGATGQLQTGLGPYKETALKEIATKYEPDLNHRADSAQRLLNLIAESRELMRNFTPNAAQDVRTRIAAMLKALGAKEGIVSRVNGGDVGSVQAFDKLAVQGATEAMAQLFRGSGSKFTQSEWNRFQSAYPTVKTDPGAISKMYDFMTYMAHNAQLEQKYFNIHKAQPNYDLTQWPAKWQETAQRIAENYWKARLPPARAGKVLEGAQ